MRQHSHRKAPLLGEHSVEVLTGLGYTPPDIARLVADGVVRAPGH
jgi:crotonobetainyl-CoA:carnitine CoA-transferase CaiB-like acyl-CoA transferase